MSLEHKIRDYIRRNTPEDKISTLNWERVAQQVQFYVEKNVIKPSSILYNSDGSIRKISGTTFQDGVFQFVEKKKPIPVTIMEDEKPNSDVEQLRKRQNQRKAMVI